MEKSESEGVVHEEGMFNVYSPINVQSLMAPIMKILIPEMHARKDYLTLYEVHGVFYQVIS